MTTIEEIIKKVKDVPLLAPSSTRLLSIIGDADHSLQEIASIVETDPALTVKILTLVNSAAYGLRQEIASVSKAIPYIGEEIVIGLAMSMCAPQVFNRPLLGYESKRGEMWEHGLRTAIAASMLAPLSKEHVPVGLAYTSGIVHDIGKSVISRYLTGLSPEMIKKIEKKEVQDYLEAEEAMVGLDHCVVGAELAKHWKLPAPLQAVIAFHHKPSKADEENKHLAYVVHLADMISMMGGTGTGADTMEYKLDDKYYDFISISPEGIEKIMLDVIIEFEKTCSALLGKGEDTNP